MRTTREDDSGAHRLGLTLAVIASWILACVSIYGDLRGDPNGGTPEADTRPVAPEVAGGGVDPSAAIPGIVRGAVRIERRDDPAGDESRGEGDGVAADAPPAAVSAAGAPRADGAPGVPSLPATECTARLWWRGAPLSTPVACDTSGTYVIDLVAARATFRARGLAGKVDERWGLPADASLELLVPDHLRLSMFLWRGVGGAAGLETSLEEDALVVEDVVLGPAARVAGEVIGEDGVGVAGVVVRARPLPDLEEPEPWRVTSDAEGRFSLDTLPAGPVRLVVEDPRFAPSVVEAVATDTQVVVPVSALKTIRGRLRRSASSVGLPAVARLEGSGVWPPRVVEVGADGSFAFEGVPDGVYAVEALTASDAAGPVFTSGVLEDVSVDEEVTLELADAGWAEVTVVDVGGRPVEGARVVAGFGRLALLQKVAVTGTDGRATVGPLPLGAQLISASSDGHLPAAPVTVEVLNASAPPAEPTVIALSSPSRISGWVVGPGGRPVASATVSIVAEEAYAPGEAESSAGTFRALMQAGQGSLGVTRGPVPDIPMATGWGASTRAEGRVDEGGGFRFDQLAPGRYTLTATDADFAASTAQEVVVRAGAHVTDLVLELRAGNRVEGRVLDENDAPIGGARVFVVGSSTEVTSGAAGGFDLGTQAGQVQVIVRAPGYRPARARRSSDVRGPWEIALTPARGRLEGRLRDGNGRVIEGAVVRLDYEDPLFGSVSFTSSSRGLFEAEGLVEDAARLEVIHPDYVELEVPVEVREVSSLRELTMRPGWTLELLVRTVGAGNPVAGATVAVGPRGARTDRAGRLRLAHIGAGAAAVRVTSAEHVPAQVRATGEDGDRVEVTVELSPAGALEGEVRDDLGESLVGVAVQVVDPVSGRELGRATTDEGGRYRVEGVRPGDVLVRATPPPHLAGLLAPAQVASDIRRGLVTREVVVRFDRREPQN